MNISQLPLVIINHTVPRCDGYTVCHSDEHLFLLDTKLDICLAKQTIHNVTTKAVNRLVTNYTKFHKCLKVMVVPIHGETPTDMVNRLTSVKLPGYMRHKVPYGSTHDVDIIVKRITTIKDIPYYSVTVTLFDGTSESFMTPDMVNILSSVRELCTTK